MLVLTRKDGQRLRIGDALVTILSSRGGRIRIGVEAPKSVLVRREEWPGAEARRARDGDRQRRTEAATRRGHA
jgi:carbon storage regulator